MNHVCREIAAYVQHSATSFLTGDGGQVFQEAVGRWRVGPEY
jgi:hypothetical protein